MSAASVAREFVKLSYAGKEPDPLTALRLHRLLYYAQGWSLAARGACLFPEPIQARRSGPEVRSVRPARGSVVGPKEFADAPALDEEESAFVRAVWEACRAFSASRLAEATREEAPWRDAWGDRSDDDGAAPIPLEAIADHFARQPVPGPVAGHKRWRQEQEHAARRRLEESPALDFDAFKSMAPQRRKLAKVDKR
ncbi:MAG: DUF4065 domain-containing protein [Gemmataceae bacterium]|nr:DUF4065 domain-containing protein [Gemmataceae bacterium]